MKKKYINYNTPLENSYLSMAKESIDIVTLVPLPGAYNPMGLHIDIESICKKNVRVNFYYGLTEQQLAGDVPKFIRSKTDPRINLKFFADTDPITQYANFVLIDKKVLVCFKEEEKTQEQINNKVSLINERDEYYKDSVNTPAMPNSEWLKDTASMTNEVLVVYIDEPEVDKYVNALQNLEK